MTAVGPQPNFDAVQNLLAPGGVCPRCKTRVDRLVTIRLVEGNSGPGWSQEGCIPCARTLAGFMLAPQWLRDDVARLEAAGVTQ